MARNSLQDLNDHLFAMIEKLGDDDIIGVELEQEINRAKAISSLAKDVVANGRLVLSVAQFRDEKVGDSQLPKMLGGASDRV